MANISPYYTGDSVPLRFTLTDANGAVTPSLAKVTILKPHNDLTAEASATIVTNVVTYTVPTSVTTVEGHYKAYFVLTLSYGERTYKIEFDVKINPEVNR